MGVDEENLLVMGLERCILTRQVSSSYGVEINIAGLGSDGCQ